MAETLLQVRDMKKYFKTPGGMLHAVDGITFDMEEGKTLGVVGESGCGKSTLGRVILGLLDATSGSVLFEGKETIGVSKHQRKDLRKNMQIMFQDPFSSLNPRTVSYTHLDVYKRQAGRPSDPRPGGVAGP